MNSKIGGCSAEKYISIFDKNGNRATAFRGTNGEIKIHLGKLSRTEYDWLFSTSTIKTAVILKLLFFSFDISLIVNEYYIIPNIIFGKISIFWYLLPCVLLLIHIILNIKVSNKAIGDTGLKNHGAEHMVISAYKKLGRAPTINEIRNYSRIAKKCGICFDSALLTGQLIGFVIYCITGYAISGILLFLISIYFFGSMPFNLIGMFLQFFTTKEPEEENLELAIAALTAFIKNEKK